MAAVPRPRNVIQLPPGIVPSPAGKGIRVPNLIGATRTTRVDAEAAAAPARGFQEVIAGLTKAGGKVAELFAAKAQADNVVAEHQADVKMMERQGIIQAQIAQEPDNSKWESIVTRNLGELEKELGDITMHPEARMGVQMKMEKYQAGIFKDVAIEAANDSLRKARAAGFAKMEMAIVNRDPNALEHNAKAMAGAGFITEEQANLAVTKGNQTITEENQREKEQAQYDMGLNSIRTQGPEAALKTFESDSTDLTETNRARLINAAQQVQREQTSAAADDLENAIASKTITVPEEIDEWKKDDPSVTPSMREDAKRRLRLMQSGETQRVMAAQGPEIASRLWTEADSFNPKKQTAEDYFRFRQRIDELPEEMRAPVRKRLDDRFFQRTPPLPADKKSLGEQLLTSMYHGQQMGIWKGTRPRMGDDGKPMTDLDGNVKKERWTDYRAQQKALTEKSRIGGSFARWLSINPEATEDQIKTFIYKEADKSVVSALFDAVQGAGAAATGEVDADADFEEEEYDDERTYGSGDPINVTGDLPDNAAGGADYGTPLLPMKAD